MDRTAANLDASPSPRRFILLPEEPGGGTRQGGRVRRYRLTSLARTAEGGRHRSERGMAAASEATLARLRTMS